ncbi:ectoine/hydroxyectoine ABC transporter permease subunit EhuD [Mesorhizobium sp.]|uniref:ectoine/hydroxyectoine ABC transporter permease subunit EhuD n=1 Tax=Mesorhizobium sp. TaxID=1871066 RepID=UPI000FE372D5|nr:ectoine/hydroxyectoine ABC transporter permease subunit EhuD [Mesorhizobium sp.]RWN48882.1 MAG: ectoine/hydroxyectoine ABC transporter permease subunit EhuD [Mesorhizobium sp.]RWN69014.1 MAG: ectoine/hydroxyectoine ABC transporter permease subunit EhuD [Mesorhizobium sp.]RWN69594.1 MAG: ectoine/hydroxyectoine ABC transporter permease subunit EhuD [Mesorhizobium sp.]RWN81235.1 MAG: ectoine/hydroxyectoine ABC transporter permease subunit EhuD [Mesorhizobium sp.]RWO05762.1 MAG: ectoine/hydroxy
MEWDWQFALQSAPRIAGGIGITLIVTGLGSLLALVLGLVFALLARSRTVLISGLTRLLVDFIRGTPLLVQLYVMFYVLPDIGILLQPLLVGVIGLGVHYAAYLSEVYRAGIDNVSRGQWEAGTAINLSRWQVMQHVVLPQAIPPMLPTIGNYILSMFKETPLLSVITVVEMMAVARGISTTTYRFLEPITIVGLYFLLLSLPCAFALQRWERWIKS